jgi:outer membrane protein assembly factor BamD (BamD/ComL family)
MIHSIQYKKAFAFFSALIVLTSCGNNEEQKTEVVKKDTVVVNHGNCASYYQDAKKMDSILMKETSVKKDLAERAINTFNLYASECQNDSLAPIFLLKAGQVAQSIGSYKQAEILLKKCNTAFPNFRNRGAALFLLAQLYDDATMLNNEVEAKTIYEEIVKTFPNTAWSRDAKASIANLGKTDEQLIQEFLKKNK